MPLEKIINDVKNGEFDLLEDALLLISEIKKEEIKNYKEKIGAIVHNFDAWAIKNSRKYEVAFKIDEKKVIKSLFDYLWESKPKRFNEEFLLSKVIDNQLSEDNNYQGVGNCLGLTSLYSVACLRKGIKDLKILESNNHILNCYDNIFIENTLNSGFNINKNNKEFINLKNGDLIQLIAFTYNNQGCVKYGLGNYAGAIRDYSKAIKIDLNNSDAYYNRGIAKAELGNFMGAIEDYSNVLKINPNDLNAYINRGAIKAKKGNLLGAIEDYSKALKINPNNSDAYYNWKIAKSEYAKRLQQ